MKKLFVLFSVLASTSAFASVQVIQCPKGSVASDKTLWAKVTVNGTSAVFVSNQNEAGINEKLAESRQTANLATAAFTSTDAATNDGDYVYTVRFDKRVLGREARDVTVYVYSKSIMPDENGSSYSTKYTGCTSSFESQ